jgi:hypothetical protein
MREARKKTVDSKRPYRYHKGVKTSLFFLGEGEKGFSNPRLKRVGLQKIPSLRVVARKR